MIPLEDGELLKRVSDERHQDSLEHALLVVVLSIVVLPLAPEIQVLIGMGVQALLIALGLGGG